MEGLLWYYTNCIKQSAEATGTDHLNDNPCHYNHISKLSWKLFIAIILICFLTLCTFFYFCISLYWHNHAIGGETIGGDSGYGRFTLILH